MTGIGVPTPHARGTARISRLADHWRGDEFDLTTIGGLAATWTRPATAAVLDVNGVSRTVVHSQPAWEQIDWDGDAVRETPSLLLGASDLAFWNFLGKPGATTIYVEFVENGGKAIASGGLIYLGNAGNTGARLWIDATGTVYRLNYHNGTTLVTSTLGAGPANGNRVAIRAVLDLATKIQIFQSINGAAETSGALSAANAYPAAWSDTLVYMGSTGSTNPGNTKFVRRRIALAVRSAAQMQLAW